jgi:hypothetical protein
MSEGLQLLLQLARLGLAAVVDARKFVLPFAFLAASGGSKVRDVSIRVTWS